MKLFIATLPVGEGILWICDAMMHVLKDSINLKHSELLSKVISNCNFI